jgi:hypothetical protein
MSDAAAAQPASETTKVTPTAEQPYDQKDYKDHPQYPADAIRTTAAVIAATIISETTTKEDDQKNND